MKYVLAGEPGSSGLKLQMPLVERGDEVVIIDDLSSGRMQNIQDTLTKDTVTFIEGSITDPGVLRSSFAGADGVFHQAALASVQKSIADPARNPTRSRSPARSTFFFLSGTPGSGRSSVHLRPPYTGTSPGFRSGRR